MEAIAGAFGNSLQVAFEHWREWKSRQCDFIVNDKPGITPDEYDTVSRRSGAVGIELSTKSVDDVGPWWWRREAKGNRNHNPSHYIYLDRILRTLRAA